MILLSMYVCMAFGPLSFDYIVIDKLTVDNIVVDWLVRGKCKVNKKIIENWICLCILKCVGLVRILI